MRQVCIYPGRFHPFHRGHKFAYDSLVNQFGSNNVYITCTNITDPTKSPFSFVERKQMMLLTGVPDNKIIQVKNQYNSSDIEHTIGGINPKNTILFFAISEKDSQEGQRFKTFVKSDGTPFYILRRPSHNSELKTMDKHAYLTVTPTAKFTVLGRNINSASEIRDMFSNLMSPEYEQFMVDLFGKYDEKVLSIMKSKLQPLREHIRKYVDMVFETANRVQSISPEIKIRNGQIDASGANGEQLEFVKRFKFLTTQLHQINETFKSIKPLYPHAGFPSINDLQKKLKSTGYRVLYEFIEGGNTCVIKVLFGKDSSEFDFELTGAGGVYKSSDISEQLETQITHRFGQPTLDELKRIDINISRIDDVSINSSPKKIIDITEGDTANTIVSIASQLYNQIVTRKDKKPNFPYVKATLDKNGTTLVYTGGKSGTAGNSIELSDADKDVLKKLLSVTSPTSGPLTIAKDRTSTPTDIKLHISSDRGIIGFIHFTSEVLQSFQINGKELMNQNLGTIRSKLEDILKMFTTTSPTTVPATPKSPTTTTENSIVESKTIQDMVKRYINMLLEEDGVEEQPIGKFDNQIKSKNTMAADAIIKAKKTEELDKKDKLSVAKKNLSNINTNIDTSGKNSDEISRERKEIEVKRTDAKEKIKSAVVATKSSSESVKSAVNKKNSVKTGGTI